MIATLSKLIGRASDLVAVEPLLALFLGAALLTVFLTALRQPQTITANGNKSSLLWVLYGHCHRLVIALVLVGLLVASISVLRSYLRQTSANFQRTHGRITQANYDAVQTIWGAEQEQGELRVQIYTDEEITERIESEDLTRPAVLRKRTVRNFITANPFIAAKHNIILKQNPRRKGSAYYGGYETVCQFGWKLINPAATVQQCNLIFPLPAAGAMYDDISATLNGRDVLPQMQLKDGTLVLARELSPNEQLDFRIGFKSRGVSFWYFQVREAREIRDFELTLTLPDLLREKLNYPGGCMTPTKILPTPDAKGSILSFQLDHAITSQGMGIALPSLPQPGASTNAVLGETERAWLLNFALIVLTLTLLRVRHAVLLGILFGTATAFTYGLLGDFSDLLFGFWGTAGVVLLPFLAGLAKLLMCVAPGTPAKVLAGLFLLFGMFYPCVAGLDSDRQALYLNLCAVSFLAFIAWLSVTHLMRRPTESPGPEPTAQPA